MKNYFLSALMLFFLFSSIVVLGANKEQNLNLVNRLDVRAPIDITIVKGNTNSIVMDASQSDLDNIEIIQRGGELTIKYNNERFRGGREKIKATLTVNSNIESMSLSSASSIKSDIAIRGSKFDLSCSGASNVRLTDCIVDNLNIDTSGASKVAISGSADKIELECSGASDIDLSECKAEDIECDLSGASVCKINATKTMELECSGASRIRYRGGAVMKKCESSGASTVSKY